MKAQLKLRKFSQALVAATVLIALMGCQPASKSGVRSVNNPNNQNNLYGTGSYNTPNAGVTSPFSISTCGYTAQSLGTIFADNNTNSATTFEVQVKDFLSAAIKSTDIGSITNDGYSNQSGVRFSGKIKLDQNGQVNMTQSNIKISIYDSIALQEGKPLTVTIPAASGQVDLKTGQAEILFKDQYGEVKMQGVVTNQEFVGLISYQNDRNVNNQAQPAAGTLGQFSIKAPCGFFSK